MIRAAFFDIDGTLLDHEHGSVMPLSTRESLQALHRRGVKVFLATGRAEFMLGGIRDMFPFDGVITLNGQLAVEADGTVIRRAAHDPKTIRQLVPLVKRLNIPCLIIEEKESFPVTDSEMFRQLFQWLQVPFPPFYDPARAETHPVLQFLAYIPLEKAEPLRVLPGIEITSAGGDILDVIPAGGGKEIGIAAAAAHYGFSREEIMVFGDGRNDASMLRWAGVGVAMGNGAPEAKEAADYVTSHIAEDGVKNALLHYGVLDPSDFS